jgi:hypothetical protein
MEKLEEAQARRRALETELEEAQRKLDSLGEAMASRARHGTVPEAKAADIIR